MPCSSQPKAGTRSGAMALIDPNNAGTPVPRHAWHGVINNCLGARPRLHDATADKTVRIGPPMSRVWPPIVQQPLSITCWFPPTAVS